MSVCVGYVPLEFTAILLFYISLITTTTMIDHLIGRPSPSWKRAQVSLRPFLFTAISQSHL